MPTVQVMVWGVASKARVEAVSNVYLAPYSPSPFSFTPCLPKVPPHPGTASQNQPGGDMGVSGPAQHCPKNI